MPPGWSSAAHWEGRQFLTCLETEMPLGFGKATDTLTKTEDNTTYKVIHVTWEVKAPGHTAQGEHGCVP